MPPAPDAGDERARWGAFTRLALGMALLGLAVGAVFPFFAELLGVPTRYAGTPVFRSACLAAGLVLGGANLLLARHVLGTRLRLLAGRLTDVADTVGDPVAQAGSGHAFAADLRLPVQSDDDLGATASAFNALLAALDRERRFRSVVQSTSDVIVVVDTAGRFSFVSRSVTDVLGWTPGPLLGGLARDLLHPDDPLPLPSDLTAVTEDELPAVFVARVRHRDGGWRHLEVTTSDRRTDPVVCGVLLTARDVTQRLELQERLAFQATHDGLTGLPNRSAVIARGRELLAGSAELAVLLMDLDRFKEVNDTLGHSYGDRLLAQVGRRLQPLVREQDMVARLGGDEFAVLLADVTAEEAAATALRLQAALGTPFVVDGLALDVDASIGVAVRGGEPTDIDALLRQADIAMYTAKERQTRVERYDPAADGHDRGRLVLLSELRHGLAGGQLVLHYQPKVSLPDRALVGVEALVRWAHPTRGLLGPGDFLPAVERTGLIEPLTDAVLDAALAQVRAWQADGLAVQVAVNLSARSLSRPDLAERVLGRLVTHGVPPALLRLEITESALVTEPELARAVLVELHAAGVSIAIDDFGTGYSSMGHLKHLPVDELKIDRSYVTDMACSPEDAALVRSVIDLGHELGLTVVAEGVEDAVAAELLAGLHCDAAQGFLFSRPLPAVELTPWLHAATPVGAPV